MADATFLETTIQNTVQTQTPSENKQMLNKKTPNWTFPWALEREYRSLISNTLKPLVKLTEAFLNENLTNIMQGDSLNLDAPAPGGVSWMDLLNETLNSWTAETFGTQALLIIALNGMAEKAMSWNRNQWFKSSKSKIGVSFPVNEDWWPKAKEEWSQRNFDLMRNMSTTYISRINDIVEKGVVNGLTKKEIMQQIQKTGKNMTKSRAALIARDQIGKLNGTIQKAQNEEAGLNMYTWSTANDERVRGRPGGKYPKAIPSHWIMQGVLCRWDSASVYSKDSGKTWIPRTGKMPKEHPGMAINCRCTAIPYWEELIKPAVEADVI